MSKKRQEVIISTSTFKNEWMAYQNKVKSMQDIIQKIENDYCQEIAKIKSNYALFNDDFYKSYRLHEDNVNAAINYIENEYHQLSESLLADVHDQQLTHNQLIQEEDKAYATSIEKYSELQKQAYEQYQQMCQLSDAYIDREFLVHSQFVQEEDKRFASMVQEYNSINNKQYDKLLWSMEKSKNALNDLANQLNETTFNNAKFLTQSVIKTIENLRSSKNEITVLFKSTTQSLSEKKKTIDNLSLIRQKPHSVLNQKLINQFVVQINAVNEQKTAFEKLVKDDLSVSIKTIGQKIIEADRQNDERLTKKLIMQYQIIQAKADFLLKRNKDMSDLLIQKYQNEIKKIKIDSFRRVEEIKLTYFIPSEYFQNSINLYSNFAFYINESLDEIDNTLSNFIRFNQNLAQSQNDLIYTSSKIFEDYKLNLLVSVNDVTAKLSEHITEVDRLSKEIIELESKNRLEIAKIRKDLENLDITSDYQKYIKTLEVDRFFIEYQHQTNLSKLGSDAEKQQRLLNIQSAINQTNQTHEFEQILGKYHMTIGELEKQIHESWHDHQFMLAKTNQEHHLAMLNVENQMEMSRFELSSHRDLYVIAKTIEEQELQYKKTKMEGNAFVVDYVDQTQSLINLYRRQIERAKGYMEVDDHPYRPARWIEHERDILQHHIKTKGDLATEGNRKAVTFLSQFLFRTQHHLKSRIDHYQFLYKTLLVDLNLETIIVQAKALDVADFYQYEWMRLFDSTIETLDSVEQSCHIVSSRHEITQKMESLIYRYKVLVDQTKHRLKNKSNQNQYHFLEHFYIQTLQLSKEYINCINDFFEKSLEKAIEFDVIAIREKRIAQFKEEKIINQHYNQQVIQAVTKKPKMVKIQQHLEKNYADFELRMKDQVFNINQSFLLSLKKEREKLDFIIKELVQYGLLTHEQKRIQKNDIEKSIKSEFLNAQQAFIEVETHYQEQKSALYHLRLEEMQYLEQQQLLEDQKRQNRLDELATQISQLPSNEQQQIALLEQEKAALVEEKRKNLQSELAKIEELKLSSIPVYLDQIDMIKNRIPDDYLALYKQIATAETQLINEHKTIENLFQQNFGQFLGNQSEYNRILFNDSLLLYPFDSEIQYSTELIKKSQEVLKDTIDKTQATQDNIHKRSIESKEKQKRVLNV